MGVHAVRDALAARVSQTGCTVHWIDAENKLHERIKIAERVLIVETLKTLLQ